MPITISTYQPFQGNSPALKGHFSFTWDVEIALGAGKTKRMLIKIRDCTHWNNGQKSWITFPNKRRKDEAQGKWVKEFDYIEFFDKDKSFERAILQAVETFNAQKAKPAEPELELDSFGPSCEEIKKK